MISFNRYSNLIESLDEIYPITRVKPSAPYSFDEWEFEIGSVTHTLRFAYAPAYGKRVIKLSFGVKRGRAITSKIETVTNLPKYLATILKIIESGLADPTDLLKPRRDGLIFMVPEKVYERFGVRFTRILRLRFMKTYKVNTTYNDADQPGMKTILMCKISLPFEAAFHKISLVPQEDAEQAAAEVVVAATTPKTIEADLAAYVDKPATTEKALKKAPMVKTKKSVAAAAEIAPEVIPALVKEPEAVEAPATAAPVDDLGISDKKALAAAMGGKKLTEDRAKIDEAYLRVAVANMFFRDAIAGGYDTDTKSSVPGPIIITTEMLSLAFTGKDRADPSLNSKISGTPYQKYLIVLNSSGIKTDHYSDSYPRYFGSENSSSVIVETNRKLGTQFTKPEKPRTGVSFEEVIALCKNIDAEYDKLPTAKPMPKEYPYTTGLDFNDYSFPYLGSAERKKILLDMLVSSKKFEQSTHFSFSESEDGKKKVRTRNYKEKVDFGFAIGTMAGSVLRDCDTADEYLHINSMLPRELQDDFLSSDTEVFETAWVQNWTMSGGSSAADLAYSHASKIGVNSQVDGFWGDFSTKQFTAGERYYEVKREVYEKRHEVITKNFEFLYDKSQEFFKKKFKNKYENTVLTLYRGVGLRVVDQYVPGALESWTLEIATAKRFAQMMARTHHDYTILEAQVPIQHIFGSYESLTESFPAEKELKGKKEYIVMGGTFATTPVRLYDVVEKAPIKQLSTFKDFVMAEEKKNERPGLKIITPSSPNFARALKTAARGADTIGQGLTDSARKHYIALGVLNDNKQK